MENPTVTVLGAGYVGLTTAVLFANLGLKTYLIEPDDERRATIESGISFFYEEGINPLLQLAIDKGSLQVTDDYAIAIPNSDFVFSCVGTPDNPDGTSNLSFVFAAAESSAPYLKKGARYIQKSTVPVGTGAMVSRIVISKENNVSYISNPEFLREGTAIVDSLYTDRIVVGGINEVANQSVIELYRQLTSERENILLNASLTAPNLTQEPQYISTNLESAELIKVTANAFLALKISFANSIAKLSDATGADIYKVMEGVGADKRIGHAFLNAGRGYGGGCFPKDVSGLITSSLGFGVEMPILTAAQSINESMPQYIVNKLEQHSVLRNASVCVLGLSFKAGTSDIRKSPGIAIIKLLEKAGAHVKAHDPAALEEVEKYEHSIKTTRTIEEALKDTSILIITTEWPEYISQESLAEYKNTGINILVDAVNRFIPEDVKNAGITYLGVGRS